jgi:hypothetical protein
MTLDTQGTRNDVKEKPMRLYAKARLVASHENPTDDGVSFDTLIDGPLDEDHPEIQELTKNDGSHDEPSEQSLLIDDLPAWG